MSVNERTTDTFHLSTTDLHSAVTAYLAGLGCSADAATAVASVVTMAEIDGAKSHGVFRLPGYAASLRSGKVNKNSQPAVTLSTGGLLAVDGDRGFAPAALEQFRNRFCEVTNAQGIAALALKNVFHFSALWADVEWLCRQGLVAMAFTNYVPYVAPAGGTKPIYGTNPMAFGWPRPSGDPMIFDQASSVMARGDLSLAARAGHDVALGTGIDKAGNPTTSPQEILEGAMLTFGGYKGSNIALMVELLAGPLIGENLSFESELEDNADGGPPRGGQFLLAVSPSRLSPDAGTRAERLFEYLGRQAGTRLPASRRYANREIAQRDGVWIERSAANLLGFN